jgi:hypothetical protein
MVARAVIVDNIYATAKTVGNTDYPIAKPIKLAIDSSVQDLSLETKTISTTDYSIFTLDDNGYRSIVDSIIPFRVRFATVGVSNYGPSNPAPIGIAVIGFNNYIL